MTAANVRGRGGRDNRELRQHYELEKRLAERLRTASAEARRKLYPMVYDELFRSFPDLPFLHTSQDPQIMERRARKEWAGIHPFLKPGQTFLEIGSGGGHLTRRAAQQAGRCIAVDVSREVAQKTDYPSNVQLVLSDGISIPVEPESVDVAYSNQLMEHLHPDDAVSQLAGIYASLKPGGYYICRTPSRLTGPYDVSRSFDDVATGFHLKEYTVGELRDLFLQAGFKTIQRVVSEKGIYLGRWPAEPFIWLERLYEKLPLSLRRRIKHWLPVEVVFNVTVVARK